MIMYNLETDHITSTAVYQFLTHQPAYPLETFVYGCTKVAVKIVKSFIILQRCWRPVDGVDLEWVMSSQIDVRHLGELAGTRRPVL